MTARTAAARKPASATSAAPIQLKSRPKTVAREPLFAIDGVDYTMPVTVTLGDSISLQTLLRIQPDEDAKRILLVRELCGKDAINALLADATMTKEEWKQIGDILTERALGPLEEEEAEGN